MSYDRDKLGTMTFEVSVSTNRGAGMPEGILPLLTAAMTGTPLVMQIAGQDAFLATPTGLDSEHGQTITHRATFKVEKAPVRRKQDDGDVI